MKKIFISLVAILTCATTAFAGSETFKKEYPNIAPFDKIDISSIFKVNLSKGNKCSVVVTADKNIENDIRVFVIDGKLIVNLKKDYKWFSNKANFKIDITMPVVHSIELSGVVELNTADKWDQPYENLKIELNGCSKIQDLKVNAQILEAEVSGVSKIGKISGTFLKVKAEVSGTSSAAFDLDSDVVNIEVSGASKAELAAISRVVDAEVSGASKMKLTGTISQLLYSVSGVSSLDSNGAKTGASYDKRE